MPKKKAYVLLSALLLSITWSCTDRHHSPKNQDDTALLSCTHPQVCRLLKIHLELEQQQLAVHFPLELQSADPHHFEPTARDLQRLWQSEILITAPLELQPWLRAMIQKRKRAGKATFVLAQVLSDLYPQANPEALAHFWPFPQALCLYSQQLSDFLQEVLANYQPHLQSQQQCQQLISPYLANIDQLKSKRQNFSQSAVILAHDALTPILQYTQLPHLVLRGGGHGERILPSSMRQLEELIAQAKENPLYWVDEYQIIGSTRLRTLQRPQDHILPLFTDGPSLKRGELTDRHSQNVEQYFLPLSQFLNFLTAQNKSQQGL